ncbi:MAG: sortase family protein [Candidatus Woesebacteria bacterium GW2011_GWA1_33_30]|uniref:Sortase family protein n=1 Tax=Candidatus Woesebacteria bacterium GW2011_GWA2_33_28 TaxID=1618561 RepID=A0A0G0A8T5_9BACT|nr:MAG: sortase family protein [Candidatus Woesebacteria bacterium GW2011_GWA2_33_28]KKP48543.1 MAG: sortase family protein [Candidatus Woesebacteria bacterium GW2011_GWA1_33_30]KKP49682.1 MAG: sortase family protein [Microgenomates group bacterium GW2011_GWC1_33_32]KKP52299.1 MAG: sortase family protein [Candidatus Woesebacteria bacterium GW2011_GWB1_33_38]KKP58130.1 MAG: sortase family protein [Microgenomates group bacterium GW2011_GWD1_33_9]
MRNLDNRKKRNIIKTSAFISGISGLVILVSTIWPIISYQLTEGSRYKTLLTPLVLDKDFTKASNWFPEASKNKDFGSSKVSFYTISIPKLKIQGAVVAIGGEDLTKHLIQYPGTALPGKNGNAVIFGHSVLPIFYNPKSYTAIFSTLPTLEEGDDVFIEYDGISYKFRVEELFEIYPTDIQILEQNSTDSFITLVTCVPPGDPRNPKRLIVRARVVSS